jgi:uncharacterized RDD family membrane protein YckC
MKTQPHPDAWRGLQGNYAGSVSRFVAYAIDIAASYGLFTLGLTGFSFAVHIITGRQVSWNKESIIVVVLFVIWEFVYFAYSWSVGGKTIGMAVLGVRVVRADGRDVEPRQAIIRTLALPLSILLLGLGFIGILLQREHRALHDLIAGTAVVYAWDARAARLRLLAREALPGGGGPGGGGPGGGDVTPPGGADAPGGVDAPPAGPAAAAAADGQAPMSVDAATSPQA